MKIYLIKNLVDQGFFTGMGFRGIVFSIQYFSKEAAEATCLELAAKGHYVTIVETYSPLNKR